jgi:ribosomal-protein-alanine N-acetyltransferase
MTVGPLRTRRLRLEPLSVRHLDHVVALRAQPLVSRWFRGPLTREEVRASLEADEAAWREGGPAGWAAFRALDGEFVGQGGASWSEAVGERAVEVGWSLLPAHWGRGYATELGEAGVETAFFLTGVERVHALALPENRSSIAVMERLGMSLLGQRVHDGRSHVVYAVSRQQWARRHLAG